MDASPALSGADVWRAVGAELRRLRVKRGLSLAGLSRLVHYSKGYLSKIETGNKRITPEVARCVDEALGTGGVLVALVPDLVAPAWKVNESKSAVMAASRPVPHQLPVYSPHFVGRVAELGQLTTLVDTTGVGVGVAVITAVEGIAGIGKTALALHWAHQEANS